MREVSADFTKGSMIIANAYKTRYENIGRNLKGHGLGHWTGLLLTNGPQLSKEGRNLLEGHRCRTRLALTREGHG